MFIPRNALCSKVIVSFPAWNITRFNRLMSWWSTTDEAERMMLMTIYSLSILSSPLYSPHIWTFFKNGDNSTLNCVNSASSSIGKKVKASQTFWKVIFKIWFNLIIWFLSHAPDSSKYSSSAMRPKANTSLLVLIWNATLDAYIGVPPKCFFDIPDVPQSPITISKLVTRPKKRLKSTRTLSGFLKGTQ